MEHTKQISISKAIQISVSEITFNPIRARGPGGQNVNKVSSSIQLRFDIQRSSLPANIKENLLRLSDKRITKDGVIVIKAQRYRTQEKNRDDAIQRLQELIAAANIQTKKRRPTKPTQGSRKRRIKKKIERGRIKALRGKIDHDQ